MPSLGENLNYDHALGLASLIREMTYGRTTVRWLNQWYHQVLRLNS